MSALNEYLIKDIYCASVDNIFDEWNDIASANCGEDIYIKKYLSSY